METAETSQTCVSWQGRPSPRSLPAPITRITHAIPMRSPKACATAVVLLALVGALPLVARAAPAASCTVAATDYQGWKAEQISNPWVKLVIVPQLGGRLMEVT